MYQPKEAQKIVYNGLLEASQYLYKLGSNLCNYSTKYKTNKILKTNLATEEDTKIAIDKFFLICDVTRKSLDNAEDGVKKVINDYTRFFEDMEQDDSNSLHTIKFDNMELKVSNKIKISHYTSAHVILKRLKTKVIKIKTSPSKLDTNDKKSFTRPKSNKIYAKSLIENKTSSSKLIENMQEIEDKNKNMQEIEDKNKRNLKEITATVKAARIRKRNINNPINKEVSSSRNSKEIIATVEASVSQKAISEGQEDKEREILNVEKKVNTNKEDTKKTLALEKQDDEMEKSLGKLSSTGGNDKIRIQCVDINKLIDKAKQLNCRLEFKSNRKISDESAKIEIKEKNKLPLVSKESNKDFVNKPFSIKLTRLHKNLQIYKDVYNIKKIIDESKEINYLKEDKHKEEDIHSCRPPSHSSSTDFVLRYSESEVDEQDSTVEKPSTSRNELLRQCEEIDLVQENIPHVKESSGIIRIPASKADHSNKNKRVVKVSLSNDDDSDGEETVSISQTETSEKKRLYSPATKRRLGYSSSSSSSSSDYSKKIKKV